MKNTIQYICTGMLLILGIPKVHAQVINWARIDSTKHIGRVYAGLNHGAIYGIHYAKKMHTKYYTFIPFIDFSSPLGAELFDDITSKIGTSFQVLNLRSWVLSGDISFVDRQNSNPFVRMRSLGIESAMQLGFYKEKWFAGLVFSNDYSFATRLRHTKAYKGNYSGVVDGWYQNTANNVSFGLNTGYSFKKIDSTLSPGLTRTDGLRSTPALSFYVKFGVNYRF